MSGQSRLWQLATTVADGLLSSAAGLMQLEACNCLIQSLTTAGVLDLLESESGTRDCHGASDCDIIGPPGASTRQWASRRRRRRRRRRRPQELSSRDSTKFHEYQRRGARRDRGIFTIRTVVFPPTEARSERSSKRAHGRAAKRMGANELAPFPLLLAKEP